MTRRAWTWGVGLLVLGAVVAGSAVGAIASYHAPAGSQQSLTLGQLFSLVVGVVLLLAGAAVVGKGLRRRRAAARRRQLRDRLARDDRG